MTIGPETVGMKSETVGLKTDNARLTEVELKLRTLQSMVDYDQRRIADQQHQHQNHKHQDAQLPGLLLTIALGLCAASLFVSHDSTRPRHD
jgi:hypothetical protein